MLTYSPDGRDVKLPPYQQVVAFITIFTI